MVKKNKNVPEVAANKITRKAKGRPAFDRFTDWVKKQKEKFSK